MKTARAKAPFGYYGGKQLLSSSIVALMPPHDTYVEAFGGGASVLCSKPPSKLEVYNDIEAGLVNFFRVLRDTDQCKRLQELLDLTPYARAEYEHCRQHWHEASDPVEMARAWYVSVVSSFSHHNGTRNGWSFTYTPVAHKPRGFRNLIADFTWFSQRWRYVQVEQLPALELIRRYDRPRTLFYLDPPYVHSTRRQSKKSIKIANYAYEMDDTAHRKLLEVITGLRGMVMLSGYRSPLYDEALSGWRRVDFTAINWSDNTATSKHRSKRVECLWLSPSVSMHQPSLFAESKASA